MNARINVSIAAVCVAMATIAYYSRTLTDTMKAEVVVGEDDVAVDGFKKTATEAPSVAIADGPRAILPQPLPISADELESRPSIAIKGDIQELSELVMKHNMIKSLNDSTASAAERVAYGRILEQLAVMRGQLLVRETGAIKAEFETIMARKRNVP